MTLVGGFEIAEVGWRGRSRVQGIRIKHSCTLPEASPRSRRPRAFGGRCPGNIKHHSAQEELRVQAWRCQGRWAGRKNRCIHNPSSPGRTNVAVFSWRRFRGPERLRAWGNRSCWHNRVRIRFHRWASGDDPGKVPAALPRRRLFNGRRQLARFIPLLPLGGF